MTLRSAVVAAASAALLFVTSCSRDEPKPSSSVAEAVAATPEISASARSSAPVPSAQPTGPDPCPELCSHSRELGCANAARCAEACREMLTDVVCADQLHVAMRCFAAQPASHWECGEDGLAAVKDGHCHAEQARYVECVTRATGR